MEEFGSGSGDGRLLLLRAAVAIGDGQLGAGLGGYRTAVAARAQSLLLEDGKVAT